MLEKICQIFFSNFQKFQKSPNFEIVFDSPTRSASFGERQLVLSLKIYSWRRFSRTVTNQNQPIMTSLWRQFTAHLPGPQRFLSSGCAKLIKKGVYKVWWRYLLLFLSYGTMDGVGFPTTQWGAGQLSQ